jgi:hypothetical protein
MLNTNWKCWVVWATYSARCHKEYTGVEDVLTHYNPWCLFIIVIREQISLLEPNNLLTLQNKVELRILLITNLSLNTDRCKNETDSKKGNTFGLISCCASNKHILTHTQIYIYIYESVNEGNKLWSFASCPWHQFNINFFLSCPNNFLLMPCSPNPIT